VHHHPSKKSTSEIPIPQYNVVDTYERDYTCTFSQPTSYLRGRGGRFLTYFWWVSCKTVCNFINLVLHYILLLCSQGWDWGVCWVWSWQWGWWLASRVQQWEGNSFAWKVKPELFILIDWSNYFYYYMPPYRHDSIKISDYLNI